MKFLGKSNFVDTHQRWPSSLFPILFVISRRTKDALERVQIDFLRVQIDPFQSIFCPSRLERKIHLVKQQIALADKDCRNLGITNKGHSL